MIKNVLTGPGIAFLIFFIAFNPNSAAPAFESLEDTTADAAGQTSSRSLATVLWGPIGPGSPMAVQRAG